MIRSGSLYGIEHTIKPGRGEKFKQSGRSKMRPEWAEFCIEHCPHPDIACKKRPCKEFRERFGKDDDT